MLDERAGETLASSRHTSRLAVNHCLLHYGVFVLRPTYTAGINRLIALLQTSRVGKLRRHGTRLLHLCSRCSCTLHTSTIHRFCHGIVAKSHHRGTVVREIARIVCRPGAQLRTLSDSDRRFPGIYLLSIYKTDIKWQQAAGAAQVVH